MLNANKTHTQEMQYICPPLKGVPSFKFVLNSWNNVFCALDGFTPQKKNKIKKQIKKVLKRKKQKRK